MKKFLSYVVMVSISLFVLNACIDIENPLSVQTGVATDITSESAVLNGNINFEGGSGILSKGFYVSEDDVIDENDYVFYDEDVSSKITITVTGMQANTTYFFKAFATNSSETAYGNINTVTTLSSGGSGGNINGLHVQTNAASEITSTSAKLMATIISDGGSTIIDRGFYIDLEGNPDENDYAFSIEGEDNPFGVSINGMEPQTTYYYTAYITTESLTTTGDILNFTTMAEGESGCSYSGSIIDSRDNRSYNTIQIGAQTWMAENMAYDAGAGSWAYNNDESNVAVHGRLYTWEVAMNVCPSGWHLPSNEEWDELAEYISADQGGYETDGRIWENVGTHLKTPDVWTLSNNESATGTNDYCFSAVPGGIYEGEFRDLYTTSEWWTNFEHDDIPNFADIRELYFSENKFFHNSNEKSFGLSVRCIKD